MFLGEALIRIKGFIINKRGIKKMRKIGTIFVIGLLLVGFAFAGGIVHNTNNSADFIRLMNRNASTDVDAVYFNPAGLTYLNEGLHFYLSSQTIYQTRTITSDVSTLNSDTFEGSTFAPVFPNFYVAYKMGDLAFGAGLVPIGGGGSAIFEDGLPSFEAPASALKGMLAGAGVTGYNLDIDFEGSSIYLGGQAVVSYKVNDMISVAGGARYFAATNTYVGHLKDIMVSTAAGDFIPGDVLRGVAGQYAAAAASAQAAVNGLSGGITAGLFTGDTPLAAIDADGALAAGLIAFGIDPTGYTVDNAIAAYTGAGATATATAAGYTAQAGGLDVATADLEVDTKQTGSGFAPIVGLYLTPMEGLAISLRYEGKAAMTLTNETVAGKDGRGMFADGAETGADMPAMASVGFAIKAAPSLQLVADMNYYFNTGVDWDGKEDYLKDGMEAGFGLDFAVNESLQLSAGVLRTLNSGALPRYHTDLSYSLTSSTIGAGGRYYINPNLYLSFGVSSTFYDELSNPGVDYDGLISNETYDKSTIDFAIGIGYSR